MMLARKWDRIEKAAEARRWDIFTALEMDPNTGHGVAASEGLEQDVIDLVGYLLLVLSEMEARRAAPGFQASRLPTEPAKWPQSESPGSMIYSGGSQHIDHPAPFGFDEEEDVPPAAPEVESQLHRKDAEPGHYDYGLWKKQVIQVGSMKGRLYEDLFNVQPSGRLIMKPSFVEEYAR